MTTIEEETERLIKLCNNVHRKLRKLEEEYKSCKLMEAPRNYLIRPITLLQKELKENAENIARNMIEQSPDFYTDREGLTNALTSRYGGKLKFN
jgi:hypothetical protein